MADAARQVPHQLRGPGFRLGGGILPCVDNYPATICYVKNQALGFEIPWRDGAIPRRYLPDFIVRLDDGHGPEIR